MSQQAQIGKPPQPEKPPPSLSQSYRTIYTFEKREPVSFEGVTFPITEQQFEERVGENILSLPLGALITGVSVTEGGYSLRYELPPPKVYPGSQISPWKLARLVQAQSEQAPETEPISYYEYVTLKPMGIPGPQQIAWKLAQLEASVMPEYEPEVTTAVPLVPSLEEIGAGITGIPKAVGEWWAGLRFSDRKLWKTDPVTGIYVPYPWEKTSTTSDMSGRAYAWTVFDIYNITSTALLAATAAHSIVHLPHRIAVARSYASREAIRQQFVDMPRVPQEETGWKEFWQQIQEPLATKPKAEQWYMVTRGMPTTPMSKTLEKAVYQELAKGGISAEQVLVPRTAWEMSYALEQIHMIPKTYPLTEPHFLLPPLLMPFTLKTSPATATRTLAGVALPQRLRQGLQPTQITRLLPQQMLKPMQMAATMQIQQQIQVQVQQQATLQRQSVKQLQRQLQIQVPQFEDWLPSQKRRRRGKESLGLFGRYKRFYPVMTGVEVAKLKKIRGLP